jgi:hypothetical protein
MRRRLSRISARIQHGGSSLSFRYGPAFQRERGLLSVIATTQPGDVNSVAWMADPPVVSSSWLMQQVWSNEPNFAYWKCTTRLRLGNWQ